MRIFLVSAVITLLIAGIQCQDNSTESTTDGASPPQTDGSTATATTTRAPEETTVTEKGTTVAPPAAETTSPAQEVSTQSPTSAPSATTGTWIGQEGTNTTCIRMKMQLTFNISYQDSKGANLTKDVHLPGNESEVWVGEATCDATAQSIVIPFNASIYDKWTVTFHWEKDDNDNWVQLVELHFVYTSKVFPDLKPDDEGKAYTANYRKELFKVSNDNSYQCHSDQSYTGWDDDKDNKTVHSMDTKDLQSQAFGEDHNVKTDFGDAIPCPADSEVSNIVPIAVGAALAALVVIVLIAYLIGRRRSKRGYESV